jgi:hypothetical protein
MSYNSNNLNTQNDLLMKNLRQFYKQNESITIPSQQNLAKMMAIVNGESKISLRIIDWFVTNFSKKYFVIYDVETTFGTNQSIQRFKVYNDYKLKLKAYSKRQLLAVIETRIFRYVTNHNSWRIK